MLWQHEKLFQAVKVFFVQHCLIYIFVAIDILFENFRKIKYLENNHLNFYSLVNLFKVCLLFTTTAAISAGWHFVHCVSSSHVCSSGGSQRCPCGRIQHGEHTGHHALQVCFIYCRTIRRMHHFHSFMSRLRHTQHFFLCFRFHFHGPCGTTLPPALARHETEQH